jgi:hypothetical protein
VSKLYPLADYPTLEERPAAVTRRQLRCKATGEFRAPKKGEWYLSGAIPAGYKAPNDLSSPYHIARLVALVSAGQLVSHFARRSQ